MNIYRHGDVDIIECNEIPSTAVAIENNVLAYGERTGHSHAVHGDFTMYEDKGIKYLEVRKATLFHQQHSPNNDFVLNPGRYLINIEREFDPFTQEVRKVKD